MCIAACLSGKTSALTVLSRQLRRRTESVNRPTLINLWRLKSLNCFDVLLREGSDIDAEVQRVRIHLNDRLLRQRCDCGRGEVQA